MNTNAEMDLAAKLYFDHIKRGVGEMSLYFFGELEGVRNRRRENTVLNGCSWQVIILMKG